MVDVELDDRLEFFPGDPGVFKADPRFRPVLAADGGFHLAEVAREAGAAVEGAGERRTGGGGDDGGAEEDDGDETPQYRHRGRRGQVFVAMV